MLAPIKRLVRSKSAADCSIFALVDGKSRKRHSEVVTQHEGGFDEKRGTYAKAPRRSEYGQIVKQKSAFCAFLGERNQTTAMHSPKSNQQGLNKGDAPFRSPQRISITLPYATYQKLLAQSDHEGRSLSNLAAFILELGLKQVQNDLTKMPAPIVSGWRGGERA